MKYKKNDIHGANYVAQFAKEELIKDLLFCGFNLEDGYRLSNKIDSKIKAICQDNLSSQNIKDIIRRVIVEAGEPDCLKQYENWQKLCYPDKPIIILLGGISGVGKSTIATELGYYLNINRSIGTDTIRQIMRMTYREEVFPSLHASSFELADNSMPDKFKENEMVLKNFKLQSECVCLGVEAALKNMIKNKVSAIIEGVNLQPGCENQICKSDSCQGITIVYFLLALQDQIQHINNFKNRDLRVGTSSYAAYRYLSNFDRINYLQEYLYNQAIALGTNIIDTGDMKQAIRQILSVLAEHNSTNAR